MAPSILPQSCDQDLESNHLDLPTTPRMPVANKGLKLWIPYKTCSNPAGEWHVRGLNPKQEGFQKKIVKHFQGIKLPAPTKKTEKKKQTRSEKVQSFRGVLVSLRFLGMKIQSSKWGEANNYILGGSSHLDHLVSG